VKEFVDLLLPYLSYPHWKIKQEILNLLNFAFLCCKGSVQFDFQSVVEEVAQLIADKHFKVKFVALETVSYLTSLESKERIKKLV